MRAKLFCLLLAVTLLAACNASKPAEATLTPTPLPSPTASPTSLSPLAILILPADMPKQEYDQYQTIVYDLAQAQGMRFQVRNTLTPEDVAFEGPALKVVVALPPDPGLAALTAAAPSVQFLAVNIPDLPAASNLSSIGSNGVPVDQQAFLAGYIAGLVTEEWRVGILSQKDTPGGEAARTAFENGFHFYCGDCFSPNFNQPFSHGLYPIVVRIPTDAPEGDYPAYADLLARNVVNVVYVYPEIATQELLDYITQSTHMQVISETLPDENARAQWLVSIQPDVVASIKNIFPELVAGRGGQTIPTPLLLADVNTTVLTEGKLRLVNDVLTGLQNGAIGTGVTP